MATQSKYDPNILALLSKQLGGGNRLPQFAGGGSDIDPSLGAALVALGYLPRHQDTSGRYMMPGQQQGGSGLDGQTFEGLNRLKQMQPQGGGSGGGMPQGGYSTLPGDANWYPGAPLPQGFDPRHPTVIGRSPTIDITSGGRPMTPVTGLPGQVGDAYDPFKPPVVGTTQTMPYGPSVQEQNDMDRDRQMFQDNPDWFKQNMQRPGRVPPAPVRPQAGPPSASPAIPPSLLPPPVTAPRTMQPPSPSQPYTAPQGQMPDPLRGVFDQARGPVGGAFGQEPQKLETPDYNRIPSAYDSNPGNDWMRSIAESISQYQPQTNRKYDRVAPDDWRRSHPATAWLFPSIDRVFGPQPQIGSRPTGPDALFDQFPPPYKQQPKRRR